MKSKGGLIISWKKRSTLTKIECTVCRGADNSPFYAGLLKCRTCSHIFADLELTEEELSALYGRNYFFGDEYSDYLADQEVLQKNFRLRLRILKRFLDPKRHRHLIEIGCAYGFFLDSARDHFTTVQGIDITEEGVVHARRQFGLKTDHGDILQYDFSGQKFDVVCLWDTIEHLTHPHRYLEKIAGITEPGALLALTTGDIKSVNARLKKEKWRLIHPPSHLHYFSKETLTRLLDRQGFDVLYNQYCGFYRSLNNIAYNIFVLRKGRPGVYNLLKKARLTGLSAYLNLYDILFVIARKR